MKDKAKVTIDGKKLSVATWIWLVGKDSPKKPKKHDDKSR